MADVDVMVDQGTGEAAAAVVGLLFWVAADTIGAAAETALATSLDVVGVGADSLYDIVLVPEAAVARPGKARYPAPPD